jgi:sugar lactone lactonase YvrE
VNSKRKSYGAARMPMVVILSAITFGLVCSSAMQAQTYTPNDIYTIAGGGLPPTAPLSAFLPGTTSAIKDAAGNIYIAVPSSAYVYKLTSGGTFGIYTGKGFGGYGGDGKGVNLATITAVTNMAFDSKGNLYLVDGPGSRIRAVNLGGTNITIAGVTIKPNNIATVAGNGVKCDHALACGDGGAATAANLNLPQSISLDSAGNIYIADSVDNRIRVVNVGTSTITIAGVSIPAGDINTIAGQGTSCANPTGSCGDGGQANQAFLDAPFGVAVDSKGNIYIADTYDQKIRLIAAGQNNISTFAGTGVGCTNPAGGCGNGKIATSAQFRLPQSIAVDSAGDVFIADTNDHMIREIAAGQGNIVAVAGNGTQGFSGDGGAPTSAQLDVPGGISIDSSGNLLVADTGNARIRQVTAGATPTISTIAGGGNGGDGGAPTSAQLALPWEVAEDSAGNLYIVDQANNRIRKITNPLGATPTITTVAGNGSVGYSGDGGPAASATLNGPSSIAFDSNSNMYIVDSNNLVVREVSASTGNISTVFGSGNACFPATGKCGDGGPPTGATFAFPLSVALDASNNVYVSDWQGARVREWNIGSNLVSTVAGTGTVGMKGNGGLATKAFLNHPAGLVVDKSGNVYISDQYNNAIREVTVSNGNINQFALNNKAFLAGDGGPALKGSMWNPLMLAIDPAGDVFISGGNDDNVQRISAATNIYSTVAGNPKAAVFGGFSGDGAPAIAARMSNLGAFVDGNNNLFVADGGNNRVRYVPMAPGISFNPNILGAGEWGLNQTGTPVPLTVNIGGGADLNITQMGFSGANAGDFAISSSTCGTLPATLSPQQTCTVNVTLTPSSYGPETAQLNFTDNAPGSPQSVTVNGSGPNFTISASPNTVTVTAGNSGQTTITLTPQAKFAQAVTLSCPSGLPTGTTCAFSPNPVQLFGGGAPQNSTLTLQTSSTTPTGSYPISVEGAYSNLTPQTTVTLTVQ